MINNFNNKRGNALHSALSSTPQTTASNSGKLSPYLKIPKVTAEVAKTTGKVIKGNIQNVLSKKYGELDTKHLFDSIPDKDVANSVEMAENAIKTNVDRGLLKYNYSDKFPHLHDGLALSYAAAGVGNSKAAKMAREAAYTEEPLVKSTGVNLLSNDTPQWSSVPKINADNTAESKKNEGYVYKLKEEKSSGGDKLFGDISVARVEKEQNNYTTNETLEGYEHEVLANYYKDGKLDSNEYKHVSDYLNHKTTPMVAYYGRIDKNNDLENGEYSKSDMIKFNGISEDELELSKDEHIKRWKKLAGLTSWSKPKMANVLFEMIDHFADGSGKNYTNEVLNQEVTNHPETQRYMKDFSDIFKEQLQAYNGDVSSMLASNSLKNEMKNKGIYLSTYNYSGIGDLFGGLEHAIHAWTESEVEISSLKINSDGTYNGELKFVFVDDFGLDDADIKKFGDIAGFRSWFILQHYAKFSDCAPFKTIVKINYPISGKIEGYKNDKTIN